MPLWVFQQLLPAVSVLLLLRAGVVLLREGRADAWARRQGAFLGLLAVLVWGFHLALAPLAQLERLPEFARFSHPAPLAERLQQHRAAAPAEAPPAAEEAPPATPAR